MKGKLRMTSLRPSSHLPQCPCPCSFYTPNINLTVLLCAVRLSVCARVCVFVCEFLPIFGSCKSRNKILFFTSHTRSLAKNVEFTKCLMYKWIDEWMKEWASKLARLYLLMQIDIKMWCLPTVTRWHRGSPWSGHQTPGTQAGILPGARRTSELGKFQSPGRVGKCPSTNTSHSWCSTERESHIFFTPKPRKSRDDSSIFLPFACFDSRIICKDANKGKKTTFPRKWFTA